MGKEKKSTGKKPGANAAKKPGEVGFQPTVPIKPVAPTASKASKSDGKFLPPVKRAKIEAKRLKKEAKLEAKEIVETYRRVTRSGLKIIRADFPGYAEAKALRDAAKAKGKEYIWEARKSEHATRLMGMEPGNASFEKLSFEKEK